MQRTRLLLAAAAIVLLGFLGFARPAAAEGKLSHPVEECIKELEEANSIDVRGNVSDNLDLAAVRLFVEVSAPNHAPFTTPIQRAGGMGSWPTTTPSVPYTEPDTAPPAVAPT